jgi:hypothetical protein
MKSSDPGEFPAGCRGKITATGLKSVAVVLDETTFEGKVGGDRNEMMPVKVLFDW